jgi:hypothetical protein
LTGINILRHINPPLDGFHGIKSPEYQVKGGMRP